MSLLLDALKRAEQEKLARQGDRPAEHAPPPPAPSLGKPAAALELQPLAGAAAANQASAASRAEAGAQAAQAVFQAKAARDDKGGRGMLWAIVGAIAVVVIAAGAYVYYSIQSLAPKTAPAARARPAPMPPAAAGSIPTDRPPLAAVAPIAPMPAAAPTPAPAAGEVPAQAPRPASPPPAEGSPRDAVAGLLREAAPDTPPLWLQRSAEPPRVPAEVASGYEALRNGQLAAARRSYEAALAADRASVDARLGLATVEARSGNRGAAVRHYREVLSLDPRNATALAALAALADFSRPEALEVQLRDDLARHPDSAPLHFALGSLFASQSRWREAQAAFYEAHRLDPAGADILYNLAVTLDHLGQPRLAAEFYARALDAASSQAAQFDPAAARRRLGELR